MLSEGMRDQAFKTAEGVYNVVWRDRGYFFRTPEAYDGRGLYRASMYMRPGAIWSMELPGNRQLSTQVAKTVGSD
jgi:non-lysosomal glucosylceramidase